MLSDKYVRVLGGPIGSGKSVACTHELLRWTIGQQPNSEGIRKSRFLIVRNTADQLRTTTQKTVFDWLPDQIIYDWKVSEKTIYLRIPLADGTECRSEWLFIPLDTPDDIRKALSLETTGLWGNEARELNPQVVDGILMRCDRYPSGKDGGATRPGAIFDTNMPDEETWWFDKMENPPRNWSIHLQPPAVLQIDDWIERYDRDPPERETGISEDGTRYVVSPECDNYQHLSKDYYPNTMEGKTLDFINVYLRCRYGRSLSGRPVYEQTFNPDVHIAAENLTPIHSGNYPVVIGLDFGRTPAAVFMQMNPRGQCVVLSEVTSINMGLETFIDKHLRPHIYKHYVGANMILAPDPSGDFGQQRDEVTLYDVLRKKLGYNISKPPEGNDPELRIQAVERLLMRRIDEKPGLIINPRCSVLTTGFRFGYRYKIKKDGTQDLKPDKNDYSHPHDALQYGCQIIDQGVSGYKHRPVKRQVKHVDASGWT